MLLFLLVFMFPGISLNKQAHIVNGNRMGKNGYNYFFWNCAPGFLSKNKIEDIRLSVQNHNIHIIGKAQVDLSSQKYTRVEINKIYYKIVLPSSWNAHGLVRIIIYVKDNIQVKFIEDEPSNND